MDYLPMVAWKRRFTQTHRDKHTNTLICHPFHISLWLFMVFGDQKNEPQYFHWWHFFFVIVLLSKFYPYILLFLDTPTITLYLVCCIRFIIAAAAAAVSNKNNCNAIELSLDLSHNSLAKIPVMSLTNMAALTLCNLDLSHNDIVAIHAMDLSNKFRVSFFYAILLSAIADGLSFIVSSVVSLSHHSIYFLQQCYWGVSSLANQ